MKRRSNTFWLAAIAVCALPHGLAAKTAAPNAKACPRPEAADGGERQRTKPLALPPALKGKASSSLYHYAFTTLGGQDLCVNTSWMEETEWQPAKPDGRFFSFGWLGYETFGHLIIDRSGRGQQIETGVAPSFSPSGNRFASIDMSESGFGALNAFGVWQVQPVGIRQIASIDNAPSMADWKVDGWAAESCVNISAIPHDRYPDDATKLATVRRDRFHARQANAWQIVRGRCLAK